MIKVNEAGWDRIARIVLGIVMLVLGWGGFVTGTFGVILQWLGFVPLITGLIGFFSSQKLSEVPSAIFVITQDDIRRSGATSIPEALRMAPGVEVARIGTDKWAISIRGFNGRFADKLQGQTSGYEPYTPSDPETLARTLRPGT